MKLQRKDRTKNSPEDLKTEVEQQLIAYFSLQFVLSQVLSRGKKRSEVSMSEHCPDTDRKQTSVYNTEGGVL